MNTDRVHVCLKEYICFYFGEKKSTFACILMRKEYFCFHFGEKRVFLLLFWREKSTSTVHI